MAKNEEQQYLSIKDIQNHLSISYRTAYSYCHLCQNCKQFRGICKCANGPKTVFNPINLNPNSKKFGSLWRIKRDQLDRFLRERSY